MSHFFAFMSRMKYIERWSLMRNIKPENIAEHSLQVAMIAHCLALIKNKKFGGTLSPDKIASAALYHDASEILTGDMPTPIKYYNPFIRDAYKAIETESCEKLISMLPPEFQEDYRELLSGGTDEENNILRAADKISAYFKCLEEENGGNKEFSKAAKSTKKAIKDMHLPEADYFLEHFEKSFTLTLDEMN